MKFNFKIKYIFIFNFIIIKYLSIILSIFEKYYKSLIKKLI